MDNQTPPGQTPVAIESAKRRHLANPPEATPYEDASGNPPKQYSVNNVTPTEVLTVPVFQIDPYSNPVKALVQTATVFKTLGLTTAAGDTVIWTPATGKRFRMMGFQIVLAQGTTAAAASTVQIRDGATVLFTYALAGAVLVAPVVPMVIADTKLPGMGYLSTAVNAVLNLNLSTALAVGGVTVNAWGTEE